MRELLQNAIDTTIYRKLHADFNRENYQPRIDVTTWKDQYNYQWIRVDDNGMGMDEQIIRKYFLKAGSSFYNSDEFRAEIVKCKEYGGSFTPISRFGIGILSCFLAGDKVELSSRTPNNESPVRLTMNVNKKYFEIQLKGHIPKNMPVSSKENPFCFLMAPGTSIAVRIDPANFANEFNFDKVIKSYLKYPPIPIFVNGKKITTENEFLADINKAESLLFPIPKDIIDKVKNDRMVTIDPDSFVKIELLDLSKYVTKQNKGLLKGVFFIIAAHIPCIDDFNENIKKEIYENQQPRPEWTGNVVPKRYLHSITNTFFWRPKEQGIKPLSRNKEEIYVTDYFNRNMIQYISKLEIKVKIINHRIMPLVERSLDSEDAYIYAHTISLEKRKWLINDTSPKKNKLLFDVGIDLNDYE